MRVQIDKGRLDMPRTRQESAYEKPTLLLWVTGIVVAVIAVVTAAFAAGAASDNYLNRLH